jgi:hydrogenase maturation protease
VKTLILGIGNPLRSDDGIGIHVVEALREENLREDVDIKEGLSGLDILGAIAGYERIIMIDALKSGGEPGTIYKLSVEDLHAQQTLHTFSTHDVDIPTMLKLGRDLYPGKMPEDIVIIAVEAEDIETFSETCTPNVEKAIQEVVHLIKELI